MSSARRDTGVLPVLPATRPHQFGAADVGRATPVAPEAWGTRAAASCGGASFTAATKVLLATGGRHTHQPARGGNTYQREFKYLTDNGFGWQQVDDYWQLFRTRAAPWRY